MLRKKFILLLALGIANTFTYAQEICDDYTDLADFPLMSYGENDTVGYSLSGTEPIILGAGAFAWVNDSNEGIYGVGPLNFIFDGTNQMARFEVYGFYGQFNQMGFSVNGSPISYLDGSFPMTIGGVTVDLDLSPPDVGSWENVHLTFTGNLTSISHELFESGIVNLCVEEIEDLGLGCDDFTDIAEFPMMDYIEFDTVGYSLSGSEPIILGAGAFAYVNGTNEGIYGVGALNFTFDGSPQEAKFEVYGFAGQFDQMGFSINGSPIIYLNGSFPMTIGGVVVDLDLSAPNVGSWENFYLTFSGVITSISHELFESGIVNLCVEELELEGIDSENLIETNLYPNPAQNQITIESSEMISAVEIYSLAGALVLNNSNIATSKITLSIDELKTGIYLVKTRTANGTESIKKLTVQ